MNEVQGNKHQIRRWTTFLQSLNDAGWRKKVNNAPQRDKEARKVVLRVLLLGAAIAVAGLVVLAYSMRAGIIITIFGIGVTLFELRSYRRWVKWDKRARPYREVAHQMYPYDPYPNVTCWNCGKLVRQPAYGFRRYVKPTWKKFDGRWKAFCSSCGANVTKEAVEAKYGNPYKGTIWPKFYKHVSVFSNTRTCPNCGKENHGRLQNCERCGAPMAIERD
jgi:ribosomal protein S27AE